MSVLDDLADELFGPLLARAQAVPDEGLSATNWITKRIIEHEAGLRLAEIEGRWIEFTVSGLILTPVAGLLTYLADVPVTDELPQIGLDVVAGLGRRVRAARPFHVRHHLVGRDPRTTLCPKWTVLAAPGQALPYMVGGLEIQRLRRIASAKLGDRFDIRDSHEAVLGQGPVPMSVLAEIVTEWIGS